MDQKIAQAVSKIKKWDTILNNIASIMILEDLKLESRIRTISAEVGTEVGNTDDFQIHCIATKTMVFWWAPPLLVTSIRLCGCVFVCCLVPSFTQVSYK